MEERLWQPERMVTAWAAIVLPPLAWAVNLQVNYMLAAFACESPWSLLPHGVTLITLLISGASGMLAWRAWNEADERRQYRELYERRRFMALSGILLSAMFALSILAQWIPAFFIDPCRY